MGLNTKPDSISPRSKAASYYHLIIGELFHLNADSEMAFQHFSYASQFDPSSELLKLKKAEELVSLGRVVEAKEEMKKLDLQDEPQFFLLQARIEAMELNFDESKKNLDQAISIYSENKDIKKVRETTLMKVALLSDARLYDDSIEALQIYLKEYNQDEIAYYFLGKIYSIKQDRDKSIEAFKASLKIRPNFSTASRGLGLQYELDGNTKEAIQVYQDALLYDGGDLQLRQKLANLYLIEEKFDSALEQFRALMLIDPSDVQVRFRAALLYMKTDRLPEAEALFTDLLNDKDIAHDRIYFYLAALKEQQHEYKDAVSMFSKIDVSSQYFSESQIQAAYLEGEYLNSREAAIKRLSEVVKYKTDSEDAYVALASHYERDNKIAEAVRLLEYAHKTLPENDKILFLLGSFLDKAGDSEGSIRSMRKVLEVNPNHAHAMNHIGYSFVERGTNLEEAENLLLRAVQLEPQNAYITDSLGWLFYKKANFKKAKEVLEKAAKLAPNEPTILEHLADVYSKVGKDKQALDIYKRIVKIHENEDTSVSQKSQTQETTESKSQKNRIRQKIAALVADSNY